MLSCSLASSDVRGIAGEQSGVRDNGEATEPSLDDWFELEHVTQGGGEWTGTATVNGA